MSQQQLSTATAPSRVTRGRPASRRAASPLRVVPAAIRRTGSGVFAVLCMALLAAGLVALLMMNTALASGIYQLKSLQSQSGTLTDQQEQLTQVVDDLRSPPNLASRAQQLGMVPARSMAFVRLSDGSIIGTAQPAKEDQRLNVVTTPVAPPPAPPPVTSPEATAPAPAATAPAPAATAPAPAATSAAPAATSPATATTAPAPAATSPAPSASAPATTNPTPTP